VKYVSGKDSLELGVFTTYKESETLDKCFAYRRVNGAWPYLPEGVERDTPIAQQSRTGRIEKNGAVLVCEKGRMAYVQADPASGTYAGYNPLPDPTWWSFAAPGGQKVEADGKVGLAHVILRPKEGKVWIDYATRPGSDSPDLATAIVLEGFQRPPTVVFNRQPLGEPQSISIEGKAAYVVALRGKLSEADLAALPARLAEARKALEGAGGQ
jgi:hypothetical protein